MESGILLFKTNNNSIKHQLHTLMQLHQLQRERHVHTHSSHAPYTSQGTGHDDGCSSEGDDSHMTKVVLEMLEHSTNQ